MFVECFEAHERGVERGSCLSFGGQEWSAHNMDVLAGMVRLALLHGDDGKDPLNRDEYFRLVTITQMSIPTLPLRIAHPTLK